jgi:hypothetical protein
MSTKASKQTAASGPVNIHITNDRPEDCEVWGPYASETEAREIVAAFVGLPESAVIRPVGKEHAVDKFESWKVTLEQAGLIASMP